MDATENNNFGQDLAYDLRQKYAFIVGNILEKISMAREYGDFQKWFTYLDELHTEINQKLTTDEKTECQKEFEECIKILNTNSLAYQGISKEQKEVYAVHVALKKLDMWIRSKMEKHNMFGSKRDVEGL